MILIIIIIQKQVIPVLKMIVGTDKKKEVTSLAFHGLERSMTFPILNCAVGAEVVRKIC